MKDNKNTPVIILMIAAVIFIVFMQFIYPRVKGENGSSNNDSEDKIKKVEIEYQVTDESGECYLLLQNPNDYAVTVNGTIKKYDENKVTDDEYNDNVDLTLAANQVYLMESKNPNNVVSGDKYYTINYKTNLTTSKAKKADDYVNNVDIKIEPEKQNDRGQSLIIYKNNNDKTLNISGYVAFYDNSYSSKISYLTSFEVDKLKAGEEYRDYISTSESSSEDPNPYYKIYLNDAE